MSGDVFEQGNSGSGSQYNKNIVDIKEVVTLSCLNHSYSTLTHPPVLPVGKKTNETLETGGCTEADHDPNVHLLYLNLTNISEANKKPPDWILVHLPGACDKYTGEYAEEPHTT